MDGQLGSEALNNTYEQILNVYNVHTTLITHHPKYTQNNTRHYAI